MMFLLQSLVIFAVISSNIHWQWTPNRYLAGMIGVALAFGATVAMNQLLLWTGKKRRQQR
jgi:hypothetical protein